VGERISHHRQETFFESEEEKEYGDSLSPERSFERQREWDDI
jgi:hypothetical protein